jgi:MFS family permease
MPNQFTLLKTDRFWPLFTAQFLGAFVDNLYKATLVVAIAYGLLAVPGLRIETLVALAGGIFVLPFIFLTPFAGILADKFDKALIIRRVKIAEIVLVVLIGLVLIKPSVFILMVLLFLVSARSALFSPSKFSILPQHLEEQELIGGNALVNTGTYVAILGGGLIGSMLGVSMSGLYIMLAMLLACAVAGYAASRSIPAAPAKAPDLKLAFRPFREAWQTIRFVRSNTDGVFTAMLGSAWFFFVGATFLAQFPNYTAIVLKVDNFTLTFFMTLFSIGIALGGLLNDKLLHSKVEATYVPYAVAAIALLSMDLFFASHGQVAAETRNLVEFLSAFSGWRIAFDLLAISVAGGLFAVPVKAIIQARTPFDHAARVLATSAQLDAIFVLFSAVLAIVLYTYGFTVPDLFIVIAAGSIVMALYLSRLAPPPFLQKWMGRNNA